MQGSIGALGAGVLALAGALPVHAATINVTSSADGFPGACTLREAVDAAVANAAGATGCTAGDPGPTRDRIVLIAPGPYALTSPTTNESGNLDGDLDVGGGGPITIRPPGTARRTITTAQSDRTFQLVDADSDLALQDVTIDGGDVTSLASPDDRGGAILADSARGLALRDTTVSGGLAEHGGGLWIASGTAVDIRGSSIVSNTAQMRGGGLGLVDAGDSRIANSTVYGNQAATGAGISGTGAQGATSIVHVTFTGNSASVMSGGDHIDASEAGDTDINVRGSVLTSSLSVNPCAADAAGDIQSAGFNVASSNDPDCDFGATDLAGGGVNLGLASDSPRDNGGPTATVALTAASDAVDFLPASQCTQAGGTDQRGIPRPVAAGCDAGAYERATCAGRLIGRGAVVGTAASETLTGTAGSDVIVGLGGRDAMLGLGGPDTFCGGGGADALRGGAGKDLILGELGGDTLRGNSGRDRLLGGPGRDKLRGGPGRDVLRGGPGRDDQRQ